MEYLVYVRYCARTWGLKTGSHPLRKHCSEGETRNCFIPQVRVNMGVNPEKNMAELSTLAWEVKESFLVEAAPDSS